MNAHDLRVEEATAPYRVAPLLTHHLDTFASAPEGFKRLRELVLNLAVRGRLVKQSADWRDMTLADLGRWAIGSGFPNTAQGQNGLPILFAKVSDMNLPGNEVEIRSTNNTIDEGTARSIRANIHPAGTVVFPKIGGAIATNKRRILIRPTAIDNNCLGITPSPDCSTAYLYLLLTSLDFTQYQVGTSVPALSQGVLGGIPVLLPPLAEQSSIVAKVEELMALIDALEAKVDAGETVRGKLLDALLAALADSPDAAATADAWAQLAPHFDLLLKTPADVDRLQQTLLQLAVKGRLVPQNPNDEPAAELLKRIRAEKARLVAEGKIKRDKSLPPIAEDEMQYSLPQGWAWVHTPTIADTRLGKMLDKAKNRGQLKPYLRNTNVQWFRFDLSDIKELRLEDDELAEFLVLPGDLLICEGGEPGRCAIWRDGEREIYFQKALHRVRTYCGVMPEFVQLCLSVDCASGWLERFFTGATIKHFPGQELETYCVPLPPLAEQSRIVAAIASLTALCDRLRERLAARRDLSAKLAAALTESALQ